MILHDRQIKAFFKKHTANSLVIMCVFCGEGIYQNFRNINSKAKQAITVGYSKSEINLKKLPKPFNQKKSINASLINN